MMNGSCVRNLTRVNADAMGLAVDECIKDGEWRMAMANGSTNSMGSSTMSDVYEVLFTYH